MTKTFGFCFIQFSQKTNEVKPFNTAVIGEVDLSTMWTDTPKRLQCSKEYSQRSNKPYIIISCGRKFTGTTLKPIENVVFMGQVNSAERFMQFGCRAKNYFNGRTNPCNVWDLNPQCFLYSDTFKNLIDNEAKYRNTDKKEIIHAYEDCMELFELNGLEMKKATDFVSSFEEQMYVGVNDQAPAISDTVLSGSVFNLLLMNGALDKLGNSVSKAKMTVSDIPLDKPKDTNRTRSKTSGPKRDNKPLKDVIKARMALRDAIDRVPTFMKYNGLRTVTDLLDSEIKEDLVYWNNLPIECITLLQANLDDYDWHEFFNEHSKKFTWSAGMCNGPCHKGLTHDNGEFIYYNKKLGYAMPDITGKPIVYMGAYEHKTDPISFELLTNGGIVWICKNERIRNSIKYWLDTPFIYMFRKRYVKSGRNVCVYDVLPQPKTFDLPEDEFITYCNGIADGFNTKYTNEEIFMMFSHKGTYSCCG